jgi:hypothetical protein
MDAAIIVALIALAGAVANIGLTYSLNARSERRRGQERSDARWRRYQASLAFAADDLSSRIGNILGGKFLDAYGRGAYEQEAIQTTLFRFAQYFGWSEIVRRYARDPDPRHVQRAQRIQELQGRVAKIFSTDSYGRGGFMIWREAQHAVGELMVTVDEDIVDTMGAAEFVAKIYRFRPWTSRMEDMIRKEPPSKWHRGERRRLRDVAAALDVLDDELRPSSDSQSQGRGSR